MARCRTATILRRVALAGVAALAGCIHRIEPAEPLLLKSDVTDVFPVGTRLQVLNGYEAPRLERLRSDGIHHLEIDYQRWTRRLVLELEDDLARRHALPGEGEAAPRLLVWITRVEPPEPLASRSLVFEARVQSAQGAYAASHRLGDGVSGFGEAFVLLRRRILDDEKFRDWVLRQEVDS